jgi:hypothetical protein
MMMSQWLGLLESDSGIFSLLVVMVIPPWLGRLELGSGILSTPVKLVSRIPPWLVSQNVDIENVVQRLQEVDIRKEEFAGSSLPLLRQQQRTSSSSSVAFTAFGLPHFEPC